MAIVRRTLLAGLVLTLLTTVGAARATTGTGVAPFLDCVTVNVPGNSFTAYWGYSNTTASNQIVPFGASNAFAPAPTNRGQATLFFPGLQQSAFTVTWIASATQTITWSLLGEQVTAGPDAPLCTTANSAPVLVDGPVVDGSPVVGGLLVAGPGVWAGAVAGVAYQWQSEDPDNSTWSDIAGSTAATYSPTADEIDHPLRVQVTADSAGKAMGTGGASTASLSCETAPVTAAPAAGIASITGLPLVGSTLTADPGTWVSVSSFDYDWQRCAISCASTGGTETTYEPAEGDAGFSLRVVVTPAGESSPEAVSPQTAVVEPPSALSVSPSSLDFGSVKVGRAKSASLTVKNTGGSPLALGGFDREGADAAEFGVTTSCSFAKALRPGRTCSVAVRFAPGHIGARSAQVLLVDAAGGGPEPIALAGAGS